jgi:hypothetical protein
MGAVESSELSVENRLTKLESDVAELFSKFN